MPHGLFHRTCQIHSTRRCCRPRAGNRESARPGPLNLPLHSGNAREDPSAGAQLRSAPVPDDWGRWPNGTGDSPDGAHHPRRRRDLDRVPRAPAHAQPRVRAHLRRHGARCTCTCSATRSPDRTPSAEWVNPPMRPEPVGHPARRGERCAPPSVAASPDTRRNHVHRTHRNRDHRSRPGRPVHRVPPDEAGPRLRRPGQQQPDRRQLAPALGHPAALQPGEVRRPPRHALPGRPLDVPPEGRGRRLPRELRTGVRPAGADEHQCRRPGTAARRGLRTAHRRQHNHLRQRGRGDRHLRADAKHPGLRPPARPNGPPAAL